MKYDEYKKLTPEQKEEYDYKFRDGSYVDAFIIPLGFTFTLMLLIPLFLIVSKLYFPFDVVAFQNIEELIRLVFTPFFRILDAFVIYLFLSILYSAYKEKKWIKANVPPPQKIGVYADGYWFNGKIDGKTMDYKAHFEKMKKNHSSEGTALLAAISITAYGIAYESFQILAVGGLFTLLFAMSFYGTEKRIDELKTRNLILKMQRNR